jgi:hypothetical protein
MPGTAIFIVLTYRSFPASVLRSAAVPEVYFCVYTYALTRLTVYIYYIFVCLPVHSTGRFHLLRKYKCMLFRDEEEDEDSRG